MKKIITLLIVLLVFSLASCGNYKTNAEMPEDTEWESASDCNLNMSVGWNLGNTFDAWSNSFEHTGGDSQTWWGNPTVTNELIVAVKEAGFKAIRFPVTYTNHMDEDGNIDADWLDKVDSVVEMIIDNGLYCVTDVHHDTGEHGWLKATTKNYEKNSQKFANMWTQIANKLNKYGEKLLFEGYNELIDESTNWSNTSSSNFGVCNNLNQIFVDTVRATGGNNAHRNLVVSTYAASAATFAINGFRLPKDTYSNHLIIDVHYYFPQGFTLVSCTWEKSTTEWSSSLDSKLKSGIDRIGKMVDRYGAPVMLGEYGAQNRGVDSEDYKYAKAVLKHCEKYNISRFVWDDGGSYRILNRHNNTWTRPLYIAGMMGE